MRAILLVLFSCALGGFLYAVPVGANPQADPWLGAVAVVSSRSEQRHESNNPPCSGKDAPITVVFQGPFDNACVYGSLGEVRLARYSGAQSFQYAVSFPLEREFHELRGLCPIIQRCVYSPATDTFIRHVSLPGWRYGAEVYGHFSKNLVRYFDPSRLVYYFQFEPTAPPEYTLKMGDITPSVEALNISSNGKWAVFELRSYGVVRLNTETLEARRVVAPGVEYGLGSDPIFELAIADDGEHIAITGWGAGITVVSIDEACGDRPVQDTGSQYADDVIPCTPAPINLYDNFPGFAYATSPRFDSSGELLAITPHYRNGTMEQVVLAGGRAHLSDRLGYIALGDSFASGEGETSEAYYIESTVSKCHVSVRSYPYLLAETWNIVGQSVACSGARTTDILKRAGQAEQIAKHRPGVVSIGIGGNDAGIVSKLTSCVNVGTCEWASDPLKKFASANEIAATYPSLIETIRRVKADSPGSRLLVVGYPRIIDQAFNAQCDLLIGTLLNTDERIFINESVHYLNQVIKKAAWSEGATFVDIEDSLRGHELCGQYDTSAMNSVRLGNDIAPLKFLKDFRIIGAESFHPTPYGHQRIAQSILQRYPDVSLIVPCDEDCEANENIPDLSSYWGSVNEGSYVKQVQDDSIGPDIVHPGDEFNVTARSLVFRPHTLVTIELHSEAVRLGEVTADSDGSLQLTVKLPENIPNGYHALHFLGTSMAGEAIDVYRTVAVEGNTTSSPDSIAIPLRDTAIPQILGAHTSTPAMSKVASSMPMNTKPTKVVDILGIVPWAALGIVSSFALYQHLRTRYSSRHPGG